VQKGILKKWNDEKGFGFILPENSDEKIFFHISSLRSLGRRPKIEDIVYFSIELDNKGQKRAANVTIDGVNSTFFEKKIKSHKSTRSPQHNKSSSNRSALKLFYAVLLPIVIFIIYNRYQERLIVETSSIKPPIEIESKANTEYECSGKNRCNQMTSCEEALFYLRNCPGTLADGDGDGIPCEDQWCGH
jgi:cold shock CspA family protein